MRVETVGRDAPRAPAAEHPLLLPHQLAALQAMLDLEASCADVRVSDTETMSTRYGILGDKPGSGKSYVVAELLLNMDAAHLPASDPVRRQVSLHMSVSSHVGSGATTVPVNVLVVPHNIVSQWSGVLRLFSGGGGDGLWRVVSRVADVPDAVEDLHAAARGESRLRLAVVSAVHFPDIVTVLRSHSYMLWRLVFDEADSLRFRMPDAYIRAARFHWFVTASMQNLFCRNAVADHVTVAHSAGDATTAVLHRQPLSRSAYIRGFFGSAYQPWDRFIAKTVVVADNAFIDESFDVAPPLCHEVESAAPLHTRVLTGIAPRELIERLNAGDMESALGIVYPGRADNEGNIIAAAVSDMERRLENARLELEYIRGRSYAASAHAETAVARHTARVQRLEENVRSVRDRIQGATECLICYQEMAHKTIVPCCSNSFCLRCISSWVTACSPTCPMCKRTLRASDLVVCREEGAARQEEDLYQAGGVTFDRRRPKESNVLRLLQAIAGGPGAEGRRILFFCDNEYAIDHVGRQAMTDSGIPYAALKGNSASINKRVREFSAGPGPRALLVNCSYYGCGLDLSAATDVIMFHAVDSRMDQQIIGRAQRPNRAGRLNVWRFTH